MLFFNVLERSRNYLRAIFCDYEKLPSPPFTFPVEHQKKKKTIVGGVFKDNSILLRRNRFAGRDGRQLNKVTGMKSI